MNLKNIIYFCFISIFLSLFISCSKKEIAPKISPEEEKLVHVFNQNVFSNDLLEAAQMRKAILDNKELFLKDLREVLSSDIHNLYIKADKKTTLPSDYEPADLVSLGIEKDYWVYRSDLSLRIPVEEALSKMASAAQKDGIKLVISSSYRSYNYQKKVYTRICNEMGVEAADRESARPGASQHQLGTVVDFGSITDEYANTPPGKWLKSHAAQYGWSLSFPENYESVTGYRFECWHYRYLGVKAVQFQQKWFKNIQQYMMEFLYAWRDNTNYYSSNLQI